MKVECLSDIATVVSHSAAMNYAQLVGDWSDHVIVPSYDWITFIDNWVVKSALKGIKSNSHFRSIFLQTVYVQKSSDFNDKNDCKRKIILLKDVLWKPKASDLPLVVPPEGLSLTMQWYLYNEIREFCSPEVQDLVCPMPHKRPALSSNEDEDED